MNNSHCFKVLSAIRTVAAYSAEKFELQRFLKRLSEGKAEGYKKAIINGCGLGAVNLIMFCAYSLAFWYGSTLVYDGSMNGGQVLTVFFAIVIGAMALGNAAPNFAYVSLF